MSLNDAARSFLSSPKYGRVTYRTPEGKRTFVGRIWIDDNGKVRGERKEDAGPPEADGSFPIRQCLLFAAQEDVIKIERQNPVYETWETVTFDNINFKEQA